MLSEKHDIPLHRLLVESRPGYLGETLDDDDPRRILLADIEIGLDGLTFFNSDIGRYILGRAVQEVQDGRDDLEGVDPMNSQHIRDIQNRIWRSRSLIQWIDEAIRMGAEAEVRIKEIEQQEV